MCDIELVDAAKVRSVAAALPDGEMVLRLVETFRLLSDPTRLRIIFALNSAEMCVCDLAVLLGVSRSAVSHQLRMLRNLRLVKNRREGKIVYYTLRDHHVAGLIHLATEHVAEE